MNWVMVGAGWGLVGVGPVGGLGMMLGWLLLAWHARG